MKTRKAPPQPTYRRRVKLRHREIAVAIVLTMVALAFLAVSKIGRGGTDRITAPERPGAASKSVR